MLFSVLLEDFRLDDGVASSPARERQQCSVTETLIRDTFGSEKKQPFRLIKIHHSQTGTTQVLYGMYDSLIWCLCMDIMSVILSGHPTRVVVGFAKSLTANRKTVGA